MYCNSLTGLSKHSLGGDVKSYRLMSPKEDETMNPGEDKAGAWGSSGV